MDTPSPNKSIQSVRFRRATRAVRSGFRRYPRALYESLLKSQVSHNPIHIPDLLESIAHHDLATLWLGHGSVIAQIEDISVVVDPVLSDRIGMNIKGKTIGIPRHIPAPISTESLIGINFILITHAHFDHLDKPTLSKLVSSDTTVIVPHRCSKLIPHGFKRVVELTPETDLTIEDLMIKAIEPKHWGARSVLDRSRGVNSYLIESPEFRILFTGDTAETSVYQGLAPIDLAVFGVGAYDPWDHMHATPEQAWKMFQEIDARYMLPVHHSTFELSDEPFEEPMNRLYKAAGKNVSSILEPSVGEIIVIESTHDSAGNSIG